MLRDAVDGLPTLPASPSAPAQREVALSARDGRRAGAAAQQLLDSLPGAGELGDSEVAARALLSAAAEDAAWAWRMVAAGVPSLGVATAIATLAEHAAACCDEAETTLSGLSRSTPVGEPVDGS